MIIQDYCNLTDSKVAYSFSKSNNKARAKTKKTGQTPGLSHGPVTRRSRSNTGPFEARVNAHMTQISACNQPGPYIPAALITWPTATQNSPFSSPHGGSHNHPPRLSAKGRQGWNGISGWLRNEMVYLLEGWLSSIPSLSGLNAEQLRDQRVTHTPKRQHAYITILYYYYYYYYYYYWIVLFGVCRYQK